MSNLLLQSDAYKLTHWPQYPHGAEKVYSYFESRGGGHSTMFFGLQYILMKHLVGHRVSHAEISEAEEFCSKVFGTTKYLNVKGWRRIAFEHGGKIPVEIKAVPEGEVIPQRNVLMTVVNTDPSLPWITNFIETMLVRAWYPISVATRSFNIKKMYYRWCEATGGTPSPFGLNDFGYRGVSSEESAGIGGMAHLVNWDGTDTLAGIRFANEYYWPEKQIGASVIASEHSTVTSHGREHECEAYEQIICAAEPHLPVSVVSDSYDLYEAIKMYSRDLRFLIEAREAPLVVRPDSGHPAEVTVRTLQGLANGFGYDLNDKGYKTLNPKVRVIYGDGINLNSIRDIMGAVQAAGFSSDNVIFGMGGDLLQNLNRDTHQFAFKCSAVRVNGEWRDVFKDPATGKSKKSKPGRLKLCHRNGEYETVKIDSPGRDVMQTVFLNGDMPNSQTFDQVRERANECFQKR